MRHVCFLTTAAMVCLLSAQLPGLFAADGAIPIWEPTTIGESGKYILTRNIDGPIQIAADGVDLDLNGFTIDTGSSGATAVSAGNVSGINIHDGKLITAFGATIFLENVPDFSIRRTVNYQVDDCCISVYGSSNGTIEDNKIGSSQDGMCVHSTGITIRRNTIRSAGGIHVFGDGSVIAENTLDQSSGGVVVHSDNNLILRNVLSNSAGIQIEGNRNHIEGNLASAGLRGLVFEIGSSNNTYRNNTARGNENIFLPCNNPSGTADFCDDGTNNTSHGDNYMPDEM